MIVPYDSHAQIVENRTQNHHNFRVFVLHPVMPNNAWLNLIVNENSQQSKCQVSHDFNVSRTMISVAHSLDSHDVRASPKSVKPNVSSNFLHDISQFGVTTKWDVKNIRHINPFFPFSPILPCKI